MSSLQDMSKSALIKKVQTQGSKLAKAMTQETKLMDEFIEVGVSTGTAFALGYINGMYGKNGKGAEVMGVPAEAIVGVLSLVGAVALGGTGAKIAAAVASGSAASLGAGLGRQMGNQAAMQKTLAPNATGGKLQGDDDYDTPLRSASNWR